MKKLIWTSLVCITVIITGCNEKEKNEVNVYSHRHYDIDKKIYEAFEKETGIHVNVLNGKSDELINKIEIEKDYCPADLLMLVDCSKLNRANNKGFFQPIKNNDILTKVSSKFISRDTNWIGLTYRARVIAYNPDKTKINDSLTYSDIIKPEWNKKVLIRSSKNVYNQSLVASYLNNNGEQKTEEWIEGLVDNFARKPQGNDRDQMKAMINGIGELAIVNTYYLGLLLNSNNPSEQEVGKKTKLFFPNQYSTGTHINISGVGVLKNSPNHANAVKLLKYILSTQSQEKYSSENFEYPVNPNAKLGDLLKSWGQPKLDESFVDLKGNSFDNGLDIIKKSSWK